jgi:glycosyltransferase involved in cell wall biosynthesis
MRVVYLLESTALCGGVKVVLRQAESLERLGHIVAVISKEQYPAWFEGKVRYYQDDPITSVRLLDFEHVIATTPRQVLRLHRGRERGPKLWHLVQGFEGAYKEACEHLELIEQCYSLPVPRLVVSSHLAELVKKKCSDVACFNIGQGLEHEFFYPCQAGRDPCTGQPIDRIFLIGPLTISIKHIKEGLLAYRSLREHSSDLKLVRISAADTRKKEEEILEDQIRDYHVSIAPRRVGEVMREGNGVLISPSDEGEGFGLPALEAMACGVPTVLSSISSFRSFARPVDYAVFVRSPDPGELANAVRNLISDSVERARLIRRGLEVAKMFSYTHIATRLEQALASCH